MKKIKPTNQNQSIEEDDMTDRKEHYDKCKELGKKVNQLMHGQDTYVGIEVLVVTIATIICDCVDEDKHFDAANDVVKEFMRVMLSISPKFEDSMKANSIPMDELAEMIEDMVSTKTKH